MAHENDRRICARSAPPATLNRSDTMRTAPERKEDPHLVKSTKTTAPAQAATKRPKRSKDQRLNLKRSYEAFLEAAKKAGSSAKSVKTPSESWPMRPYAASI